MKKYWQRTASLIALTAIFSSGALYSRAGEAATADAQATNPHTPLTLSQLAGFALIFISDVGMRTDIRRGDKKFDDALTKSELREVDDLGNRIQKNDDAGIIEIADLYAKAALSFATEKELGILQSTFGSSQTMQDKLTSLRAVHLLQLYKHATPDRSFFPAAPKP